MSMHQGLDLSRFKKVSSDKSTTTLRHSKGHEIRIAHSGLTPKMREQIAALETHDDVKRYAEGTPDKPVSKDDKKIPKPLDPASPAPVQDTPAQVPADAAPTPAMQQPAAAPTQGAMAPAPAQENSPVQAQASRPMQAPIAPPPVKTPQQIAQEWTDHDLAFQKDLAAGYIKPETYQSLYAKQDTLGKISTLFGLLVSGAGAGLTHQPNAVLEMMNNEIKNDFEAQKTSQSNAQNWYNLTRQHELQKAQIERMGFENALTEAQTGKIPLEKDQIETLNKKNKAETQTNWDTHTLNKMKMGAVQSLQDEANKLTPSPQKENVQNGVNLLSDQVQGDVAKSNLLTAEQQAAKEKLTAGAAAKSPSLDTGVDLKKFNNMIAQSRANTSLGMPSMVNEGDIAKATEEATQVADNRAIAKIYDDSFRKLDSMAVGGQLNPEMRAAMIATLSAEIARATAGRFNATEAKAQADGMFPSGKDYAGSRNEKYRKTMEYFAGQEAGTTTLNRLGLKKPFPYATKGKAVASTMEGKTITNADGVRQVMKDGKWVPVGQTQQAKK